tara:strand:- start:111 stop:419 length:309 start_codon:yes stop_codon:yes gene_type:complete
MAELLNFDGTKVLNVELPKDMSERGDKMREYVGGYFEFIYLSNGKILIVDDNGIGKSMNPQTKDKYKPNKFATKLYEEYGGATMYPKKIVGNVLYVSKDEIE